MATPNMGLLQPTPGTQGPDWANNINSNSDTLDLHDHSPGKGVPVTPAGLNINADLNMNTQTLTSTKSVRFVSQSSTLTSSSARDLYIKNGDLFYANGLTDVQITTGGSVAGSSGSITGLVSPASAVFSAQQFSFSYDTGTYADLRCRDLILSVNGGNTIKLTHAASSAYTLTLPPSPPSTASQMLTMGTTGVVSAATSPTLGTTSGVFTWQGTAIAASPTSAAVVVNGGVGCQSLYSQGFIATNATMSVGTGLSVLAGGASITGGLAVTGNTTLTGTLATTSTITTSALVACGAIQTDGIALKTRVLEGTIASSTLNVNHGLPSNAVVTSAVGIIAASSIAIGGTDMGAAPSLGYSGLSVTASQVQGVASNPSAVGSFYRVTLTYYLR